jgi:hypothetical protein
LNGEIIDQTPVESREAGTVLPDVPAEAMPAEGQTAADITGAVDTAKAEASTPGDPSEATDSGIDYFHIPDNLRRTTV